MRRNLRVASRCSILDFRLDLGGRRPGGDGTAFSDHVPREACLSDYPRTRITRVDLDDVEDVSQFRGPVPLHGFSTEISRLPQS